MAQEVKDTDTKQAIQDLADTVKASADKTNATLNSLSNKQTGTQKVKANEEAAERAQAAKEERGIQFAKNHGVDFIALSFVREASFIKCLS